jgi:hypothetical protein
MWEAFWRTLAPVFEWAEKSWFSDVIRGSTIYFPIIETFHLFALTVLFGAVVIINLRLVGLVMRDQPISQVGRDLKPWIGWSLAVILVSGAMLAASEALKCWGSEPFRIKMTFLFSAIVFHFTIQRRLVNKDRVHPWLGKLTGTVSILLWLGVGLGGKAIAFW